MRVFSLRLQGGVGRKLHVQLLTLARECLMSVVGAARVVLSTSSLSWVPRARRKTGMLVCGNLPTFKADVTATNRGKHINSHLKTSHF